MEMTALSQAEALRRRMLIAGAAGLGDTGSIMEGQATAEAASDMTDVAAPAASYDIAGGGSPSADSDLSLG